MKIYLKTRSFTRPCTRCLHFVAILVAAMPACQDDGDDANDDANPNDGSQSSDANESPDGSAPPGDGGGTSGGGDPEQACTAYAAAACERALACTPRNVMTSYGDAATCASRLKPSCLASLHAPYSSETALDRSSCAAALAGVSCVDYRSNRLPSACLPRAGSIAGGETCMLDSQCVTRSCNAYCGVCTRPAAEGESCRSKRCETGKGLVCRGGTCVRYGSSGVTCDVEHPCEPTLLCKNGTCTAFQETCTPSYSECDSQLGKYCVGNPTGTCVSMMWAAEGGPCDTTLLQCKNGYCLSTGKYVCAGYLADGSACIDNPERNPALGFCAPPAQCIAGKCAFDTFDPTTCK